ncbi:MAG: DUF5683 domain-containing protein [Gemmatimonadota bacterium]|nr:DUF5683 domain-containing protein [Gemmatimonadota bacterium]MDE2831591.1 DUF5683 domain-containing protein [Gemmatimonadota bacterium]MDE2952967.1 DUF5683 domain-containing protein [Gemmatimonadota bacterium]
MYRSLFVWVLFCLVMGSARAADRDIVEKAQAAYRAGDYASAFETLSHLPNLLGVVPLFDRPQQSRRAEIFFDLGRIHMAAGDTARARLALVEVFRLDPEVNKGIMDIGPDQALAGTRVWLSDMRGITLRQTLGKTTFWGAASRSLLLPGWGQLYRGHKKRGYGFMGASAVLAAAWLVSDISYRSAYNTYRGTRLNDLQLGQPIAGTDSDAFTQNFERAKSRAGRANLVLGLLAAVWLSNVLDHLVVEPAQVTLSVPIN